MQDEEKEKVVIVLCTVPPGMAHTIATQLLDRHLAACVNILPVRSVYRWEGSVCDEPEDLLVIKTTSEQATKLRSAILSVHPYDIPEVLCLQVVDGYDRYLSWVAGEVKED
ncbi:MAG TPA: divalent-cation tolerance protein CutA [Methanospirillum sp.]|jgi:periplasmic divalent cation tolerance protein|uniref:divalent-cation tolerance protein CutA n=1 Tax=Methanospirillum sp. TaxID=45200 RepID=UPI001BD2A645|nr:divalent-cation tolerance protein CutA [Methanospirillum sp.]HPY60395.1 divalent-cation tolerance protein CutA [Methanospirillum sp.]